MTPLISPALDIAMDSIIVLEGIVNFEIDITLRQPLPLRQADCKALMAPLISPALDIVMDSITVLEGIVNFETVI